jgi:hypothetical protein
MLISALRSVVGAMADKAIHNRCSGCPSHPLLDRFWTTYGCAFPIVIVVCMLLELL